MDLKKYKNFLKPELHPMLNDIIQAAGTVVKKLPAENTTADGARFLVENSDGSHSEYIKINGRFKKGSTFL
jgi:2-keto-3-deoxy-6-phosphogluconate aldolase